MTNTLRTSLLLLILLTIFNACEKDEVKLTPEVVWGSPNAILIGNKLSETELNATSTIEGEFAYTPTLGTSMNKKGKQTLNLLFIPDDESNYKSVTLTKTIEVTSSQITIFWENPEDIIYGTKLSDQQLNSTAQVDGKFIYTPSLETLLEVGEKQELKVDFIPNNKDYPISTKTVYINVLKIMPEITWYNRDDFNLYKGHILSDTVLTASANAKGNFSYSENIQTLLDVGWYKFTAHFEPEDAEHVESCSKDIHVYVSDYDYIISDYEGNLYHTIKIGDQHWMTENLRSTTLNDGTPIVEIKDNTEWESSTQSAYCWFDNNKSTAIPYGAYYNKHVISDNICPSGWRLPNYEDAKALLDFRAGDNQNFIIDKATHVWHQFDGNDIDLLEENIEPNGLNFYGSGFRYTNGSIWSVKTEFFIRSTDGVIGANVYSSLGRCFGFDDYGIPIRCIEE